MMKTLWEKRKSILLTWLLSYMLVLFVPIGISLIVNDRSRQMLESEIRRANEALLRQVREYIDNDVNSIKRLNTELMWNSKVQGFFYTNKSSRSNYEYDLYEVAVDLKPYKSAYSSIDHFFIYWSGGSKGIMPNQYLDDGDLYSQYFQEGNISREQWSALTGRTDLRRFLPVSQRLDNGQLKHYLAYMQSYPVENNEAPIGMNVIMMDADKLIHSLDNAQLFSGGEILVLDKDRQVLVSSSQQEWDKLDLSGFEADSGSFYEEYAGEKSQFFYVKSLNSDLIYVSILPSHIFWSKATYVRNLTYVSILCSIGGGALLAYYFVRKNYDPVRRLIRTFGHDGAQAWDLHRNEYQFIEQSIAHTLNQYEEVSSRLHSQQYQLRSHFINRLIKGRVEGPTPVEEALAAFQMQFDTDAFCVVLLYLEHNEAYYDRLSGMSLQEKDRLLRFIVANVMEETASQHHTGYMTELDEMLACVINLHEPARYGSPVEDLRAICQDVQSFLSRHYQITLTFSVSSVRRSVASLGEAYKEAMDAMEFKLVMGSRSILFYEELQGKEPLPLREGYFYPLQVEQQLMNAVKTGDYTLARIILHDIISRNLEGNRLSVSLTRCLMFNLVSTFIKIISEIGGTEESGLMNSPRWIDELAAAETMEEMVSQLELLLREVCDYTLLKHRLSKQDIRHQEVFALCEEVKQYIQTHFSSFDLNLTLLGEQFRMKPTYLSGLFKEHVGEALLDYMNKVRISHAKELIEVHQTTVTEAGRQCGFRDVNVFIRTFKKAEGITPGKFKEMTAAKKT
ncbi:MAG: hypothetical protein K0R57_294 [Paenibacillaceae bacterium]|jgi:AraC-like DNA-binding protein|nr:hypothetical protein [Paenibacillaceae bacterium]